MISECRSNETLTYLSESSAEAEVLSRACGKLTSAVDLARSRKDAD
jgi:hypothetical protein